MNLYGQLSVKLWFYLLIVHDLYMKGSDFYFVLKINRVLTSWQFYHLHIPNTMSNKRVINDKYILLQKRIVYTHIHTHSHTSENSLLPENPSLM